MKTCVSCGRENGDEMSFCLECGHPLTEAAATGWPPTEAKTVSFPEMPTVVRGRSLETQAFGPQTVGTPPPPSGGSKMLVVLGGLAALLLLLIVGAAAIVGYNYFSSRNANVTHSPSPTATANNAKSSPQKGSPWPSASPGPSQSPAASPTPNVTFTPPTEPTKSGSFTVYANSGWQLSNIDTVPLENFRTRVDGKIDVAGVKVGITSAGVNDAASKSRRIYAEFPTGALLMRTRYADGKFSNVTAVSGRAATGQWRNFPDERGKIEFCINDNAPEQNGGQFTITVTLTSAPKAKK